MPSPIHCTFADGGVVSRPAARAPSSRRPSAAASSPPALLPRDPGAHRADRQHARHADTVAALGTAEVAARRRPPRHGRRRSRAWNAPPAPVHSDSRDPFVDDLSVTSPSKYLILPPVQTPEDPQAPPVRAAAPWAGVGDPDAPPAVLAAGGEITWLSGLVLALSSFMGWYTGSGDGIMHQPSSVGTPGALGELVFAIGLVVVVIAGDPRALGIQLPPAIPEARHHRPRVARNHLRPDPSVLDPGRVPPDPAAAGSGSAISLLAAVAVIVARACSAPPRALTRSAEARRRRSPRPRSRRADSGRRRRRATRRPRRRARGRSGARRGSSRCEDAGAGEAHRAWPDGNEPAVRHCDSAVRLGVAERRSRPVGQRLERVREASSASRSAARTGGTTRAAGARSRRTAPIASHSEAKKPAYVSAAKNGSRSAARWWTTHR